MATNSTYSRLLLDDETTEPHAHTHDNDDDGESILLTEEERTQQKHVPPCANIIAKVKYHCVQWRWPILVVMGNVAVAVATHWMLRRRAFKLLRISCGHDKGTTEEEWQKDYDKRDHQLWTLLTILGVVLPLVVILDGYLCIKAARYVEHQMLAFQRQQQEQGLHLEEGAAAQACKSPNAAAAAEEEDLYFLKLSKTVDRAFGCMNTSSSSTFVVALLYSLFAVTIWGLTSAGSSVVVVQTSRNMTKMGQCLAWGPLRTDHDDMMAVDKEDQHSVGSFQTEPDFKELPMPVQDWIKTLPNWTKPYYNRPYPTFNKTLPFVKTTDGSMVFAYKLRHGNGDHHMGLIMYRNESTTDYPADFGVGDQEYSFYSYNEMSVELVGLPVDGPPYAGWCGVFKNDDESIIQDEVVCYNSQKGGPPVRFNASYDSRRHASWTWTGPTRYFFLTEMELWIAKRRSVRYEFASKHHRIARNHYYSTSEGQKEVILSLTSHSIATMERTVVMDKNYTKPYDHDMLREVWHTIGLAKPCRPWFPILLWTSIPTLLLVAMYLYRLDVPSCAMPFFLAFCMLLHCLLSAKLASLVDLTLVCLCVFLLATARNGSSSVLKYVSVEMLVWAMYTILINASWGFWAKWWSIPYHEDLEDLLDSRNIFKFEDLILIPCLALGIAVVIALLLDHPTFKMLGFGFAVAGLGSLLRSPSSVMGGTLRFLLVPLSFLTISFGCFNAGGLVKHYRLYMIVYSRRGWRFIKARIMRLRR